MEVINWYGISKEAAEEYALKREKAYQDLIARMVNDD